MLGSSRFLAPFGAAAVAFVVGCGAAMAFSTLREGGDDSEVLPTQLSQDEVSSRFAPGNSWNGVGSGNWSMAAAEEFADFPLMWLGSELEGYHLRAIDRYQYSGPENLPAQQRGNVVIFGYGDCVVDKTAEHPTCPEPLAVRIEPSCVVRPDAVSQTVALSRDNARGGAELVKFRDGHATLWTGRAMITVQAPGQPALVDAAVVALRGLGRSVESVAGADLAEPDWKGC